MFLPGISCLFECPMSLVWCNLTCQTECFICLWDIFHIFIWETAHRQHLKRRDPFKKQVWRHKLSVCISLLGSKERIPAIFFYCSFNEEKLSSSDKSATITTSTLQLWLVYKPAVVLGFVTIKKDGRAENEGKSAHRARFGLNAAWHLKNLGT